MRTSPHTSRHHADVFSHLRVAVARELATPEVAELLDALIARGWRPSDLRHRIGGLPAQGDAEQDAVVVVTMLRRLFEEEAPVVRAAAERARRAEEQARAAAEAPPVASPESRSRWIADIRSSLSVAPRVSRPEPVRLRPECVLCGHESDFFVRRDVHLCAGCVDLLATGELTRERAAGQ